MCKHLVSESFFFTVRSTIYDGLKRRCVLYSHHRHSTLGLLLKPFVCERQPIRKEDSLKGAKRRRSLFQTINKLRGCTKAHYKVNVDYFEL